MSESRRWLIDGVVSLSAAGLCQVALDYGYEGDDPEEAARVLRVWRYEVESIQNEVSQV